MTSFPRRRLTQPSIVIPSNPDADDLSHGFLTAAEAATLLGRVNPRTITRWARAGLIPAYPLGEGRRRLWRFRGGDLLRWMQSRRTGVESLAETLEWSSLFPATDATDQRTIQ